MTELEHLDDYMRARESRRRGGDWRSGEEAEAGERVCRRVGGGREEQDVGSRGGM